MKSMRWQLVKILAWMYEVKSDSQSLAIYHLEEKNKDVD